MIMQFHIVFLKKLTWDVQFLLVSLLVLAAAMTGIGWWVGIQIENGVIHQMGTYTALYVSSAFEPNLQELSEKNEILADHKKNLDHLFPGMGRDVTAVKVWDRSGRSVYTTESGRVGQFFTGGNNLTRALNGWMSSELRSLDSPANGKTGIQTQRILVTFSPVRLAGTNSIIAVVEFHQTEGTLDGDIASAQRSSWLIVGSSALLIYLFLAGFVRRAEKTLESQQNELREKIVQMGSLHARVRGAARRTATLNERFLRRISAELHDGPAQELGFALLRLDQSMPPESEYAVVQNSLRLALQEIRDISAGMGLPELESISLSESVQRAVRTHERRTGTQVSLKLGGLPDNVALPVKITAYRILQEALTNSFKHGDAKEQAVEVEVNCEAGGIEIQVSDSGKGFDRTRADDGEEHLGLIGMRERAESLGGAFQIDSLIGRGTRIRVQLPLDAA
jgi:signal transduction histidine kinase